jgi:hypothetical protein
MNRSDLVMDKFSLPQHNLLYVGMQVYGLTDKEIHINDLVRRALRKRKNSGNITDETRVIKAVGFLIGLGKLGYYRGFVYRK